MNRDRWANIAQQEPTGVQHETYDVEMGSVNTLTGNSLDNYLHLTEDIKTSITQISRNTSDIQGIHQRALLETNARELKFLTQQVDSLTEETSKLIQQTRQRVKSLSSLPVASSRDAQIQNTQQKALASKLMSVARDFQSVQQEAKEGYRNQMARQYRIAKPSATPQEVEAAIDSTDGPIFQQQLLSSRIGEQRAALESVQNRHEELMRIERSITELFELFQEMQALLDSQQEQINVINTHVEDTNNRLADGSNQMTKAIRHAKSARKLKWILSCILFWIIVIIVVVLLVHFRPWESSNSSSGSGSSSGGNGTVPAVA